ncbi:SPJ_0845 family protein [Bombilactobacillus thymidiniphilus]|uniref:Uncharacterized protein n=1 Tax=Bombilactobacillus thymidiniphilus TaxID=2923363 RepID=A0ABY4PEM2_9LACO|nr:SPJ_0845 family protein [Bombilactobacillus thymidiniphilus]UQS83742.1 hypothetical protein MOO47_00635 [Bombilactobacillus thymidiniphilus]
MGLTVKRENDLSSLFDKFASLPDDVKDNVDKVEKAQQQNKKQDKKTS